jgi:hypothetical protein
MVTAKPRPVSSRVTEPVLGAFCLPRSVLTGPSYVKVPVKDPDSPTVYVWLRADSTVTTIAKMASTPSGMFPNTDVSLFQMVDSQLVPENRAAGVYTD